MCLCACVAVTEGKKRWCEQCMCLRELVSGRKRVVNVCFRSQGSALVFASLRGKVKLRVHDGVELLCSDDDYHRGQLFCIRFYTESVLEEDKRLQCVHVAVEILTRSYTTSLPQQ